MFRRLAQPFKPLMRPLVGFCCLALIVVDIAVTMHQHARRRCTCPISFVVLSDGTGAVVEKSALDLSDPNQKIAFTIAVSSHYWKESGLWAKTRETYSARILIVDSKGVEQPLDQQQDMLQNLTVTMRDLEEDQDFGRWIENGRRPMTRIFWSAYLHDMISLALIALCLSAFIIGFRAKFRTRRERIRISRGLCPSCAYDLRADFDPGCPECGWRRTDVPAN